MSDLTKVYNTEIDILEHFADENNLRLACKNNEEKFISNVKSFTKSLEGLSKEQLSSRKKSLEEGVLAIEKSILMQGAALIKSNIDKLTTGLEHSLYGYALLKEQLNIIETFSS